MSPQSVFRRSLLSAAALSALSGLALMAVTTEAAAQSSDPSLGRVEVTGSAIRRSVDAESSVPITVISTDDLRKQGVTTIEQAVQKISAMQVSVNSASSIGSNMGGASFANMRGIGTNKTLVLLNHERIANNAIDGSAPDLNMIPLAAIERIEVLRDGASSLYGTDAIGGVINFITRRDFSGATISVGTDSPRSPGGKAQSANLGFGRGNLNKDGFNIFGVISMRKEESISGSQRDFNKRIVTGLSVNTDPANYSQGTYYNPAAPGCAGPSLVPVAGGTYCRIAVENYIDHAPKSDALSGMLKGSWRVNSNLDLGFEAFAARNTVTTRIAPVPYGGYQINPRRPDGSVNPYFPTANINPTFEDSTVGKPAFEPSARFPNPVNVQPGFAYVFWRNFPNGQRTGESENNQSRVMFTADGQMAEWDYSAKLSFNRNKVDDFLTAGYANGDMIGEGILTGIINPFGAQTAAATALLNDSLLKGLLQTHTGKVTSAKLNASRELGDWLSAGRSVQLALGGEVRREDFVSRANTEFARLVEVSTGVDPTSISKGKRNVAALYGELNLPVNKALEITGSLRHDRYSDFGSTTNPKLAFRFQPAKNILLRGSASTGFRAPSLYDLNKSNAYTNTGGNYNNPVNCPEGTAIAGASKGANCDAQFQALQGGNKDLKPEKAQNYTFGFVLEPVKNLTTSIDFWQINLTDQIAPISEATLFRNYSQFKQYFNFAPGNLLSITSNCPGPNCGYVDTRLQNLGDLNTQGLDFSVQHRLRTSFGQFDTGLQSTYVMKYEYQDYPNGPFNQNVGVFVGTGPIFRWQHNLAVNWTQGAFSAGSLVNHKSGYKDFNPSNTVKSHTTVDVYGGWSPMKGMSLLLGVRNLTNVAPPFSNQGYLFQSGGWDSRYASPVGRTIYFRATANF